MFDLGFITDIRYLLRRMPPAGQRINMLFSATLSNRVMELAYEHMNNPQVIRIEAEHITADKVCQALYHVSAHDKIPLLLGVLRQQEPKRTMVFVNTKRAADRVTGYLLGNGLRGRSAVGRYSAEQAVAGCWSPSSAANCRSWWRPTWRRAVCTSPT